MQNDPGGKEPSPSKNPLDRLLNRKPATPLDGTQKPGEEKPRPKVPSWVIGALIVALIGWYVYQYFLPSDDPTYTSVPYSIVVQEIESGNTKQAEITTTSIEIDLDSKILWNEETELVIDSGEGDQVVSTDALKATIPPIVQTNNQELIDLLAANDVVIKGKNSSSSIWTGLLFSFLPFLLFLGLLVFFGRQMTRGQQNVFGFGRSKARQNDPERPQVSFADVAGEEEAKRELTEVVDFLRNPGKYHQLGARLPRGVLLVGPPGTGKTLMARAVAGESGVPFFSISASEFVEMFVGVGASRVRDLFEKAKTASPAIVFIDEMDAVGRQRFAGLGGSNDEREQTLNQLLVEMDGFDTNQEVIVMAATNRPDVLDPALLRPGRFDRQVTIGLPDKQVRQEILKIHSRGIPLASEVDLASLAGGTTGFSGADLSNLVNEAALTAARRNKKLIETADFEDALDKVILGTVRSTILNKRDREIVATHEAGHAMVGHFTPGSDPLRKVSIVPRGRALGVAIHAPEEDRYNVSEKFLTGMLDTMLGGRAAERVVFEEITTGAGSDLQQATTLARRMIGLWGMSDEVGPVYLGTGEEHVFLGREVVQQRAFSDATSTKLDKAVRTMIEAAQDRAIKLISGQREKLDALVAALLDKETLDAAEVTAILGPRPENPYRSSSDSPNGAAESDEVVSADPVPAVASD